MSYLIDSHVLVWLAQNALGKRTRALIESGREPVYLSAASSWELAIKISIGRLRLDDPLQQILAEAYAELGLRPLAVEDRHAFEVVSLPHFHADPFDRLLIAQARVEGLKLVTADRRFFSYPIDIVPADR